MFLICHVISNNLSLLLIASNHHLAWCIILLSSCLWFPVFAQIAAPPKVTNVKIIGDLRENSKITVTGTVTGGTEGSSRVQWFKTTSSSMDGENGLEAVSTSKIAKVKAHFYSFMVILHIYRLPSWLYFAIALYSLIWAFTSI